MRISKSVFITQKETPSGEESLNAQLLIRGGFVHKEIAGVYTYLPMGQRVIEKIKTIVRHHMDQVGAEIHMPTLAPKQSRETTGRLQSFDVLMKTVGANEKSKEKSSAEYVISPSHEEIVTPLLQNYISSYKQLPYGVYQIQSKFRNEARPKAGLMRGREFLMKDLYSFHLTQKNLDSYYELVKQKYQDIFDDVGIGSKTVVAFASGGDFTKYSEEFQTICDQGEDTLYEDPITGMFYNDEVAPSSVPPTKHKDTQQHPLQEISTAGTTGVDALTKHLGIDATQTTKTLLYEDDQGKVIAVVLRGDYEVNEWKLIDVLGCKSVSLLSDEKIVELTGAERGYAGLLNLPDSFVRIYDDSIKELQNFETGTNKTGYHAVNVNWTRDVSLPATFYDIKQVKPGDYSPASGKEYITHSASEVGNIFKLAAKYTNDFGFTVTNQEQEKNEVVMGCYGIGISRLMGVIVELFHDEQGIKRPPAIAPYTYCIIGIGAQGTIIAEELYSTLQNQGIECVIDDRTVRPGEKFMDADLIGYPYHIIVSDKTLADNNAVELKERATGTTQRVSLEQMQSNALQRIRS